MRRKAAPLVVGVEGDIAKTLNGDLKCDREASRWRLEGENAVFYGAIGMGDRLVVEVKKVEALEQIFGASPLGK